MRDWEKELIFLTQSDFTHNQIPHVRHSFYWQSATLNTLMCTLPCPIWKAIGTWCENQMKRKHWHGISEPNILNRIWIQWENAEKPAVVFGFIPRFSYNDEKCLFIEAAQLRVSKHIRITGIMCALPIVAKEMEGNFHRKTRKFSRKDVFF